METNILWLSDIHYKWIETKNEYDKNENVKKLISNLIALLEKSFKDKIDKIILTGDISFSGNSYEYEKFKEMILEEIFKTQSKAPQVIPIPGNHDIE